MTERGRHTPGPWRSPLFHNEDDLAEIRKHGLTPVPALTNEAQRFVLAGNGDDTTQVALVACQVKRKRGDWKAECAERDANARLIASAPSLLAALEMICASIEPDGKTGVKVLDCATGNRGLRAATAALKSARGES